MNDFGDYRVAGKLGEGAFSEVVKAVNTKTNKTYAIKRFKKRFNNVEEIESLREIQALRRLKQHPGIIQLEEVIFDVKNGTLSLAFELMDYNLYELLSRKGQPPLHEQRAKCILWQAFKALDFVHSKGVFNRDIKPENILVRGDINTVPTSKFDTKDMSKFPVVKLADFGSCRGIHSRMPYTLYISTRWYRSPECLLFDGIYSYKMDIWGVGCILFELLSKIPAFPGDDQMDQLERIHKVLGTPSDRLLKSMVQSGTHEMVASNLGPSQKVMPKNILKTSFQFRQLKGIGTRHALPQIVVLGAAKHALKIAQGKNYNPVDYPGLTEDCLTMLDLLLQYDPDSRPSCRLILKHPWFKEYRDYDNAKLKEVEQTLQQRKKTSEVVSVPTTSKQGVAAVQTKLPEQSSHTRELSIQKSQAIQSNPVVRSASLKVKKEVETRESPSLVRSLSTRKPAAAVADKQNAIDLSVPLARLSISKKPVIVKPKDSPNSAGPVNRSSTVDRIALKNSPRLSQPSRPLQTGLKLQK